MDAGHLREVLCAVMKLEEIHQLLKDYKDVGGPRSFFLSCVIQHFQNQFLARKRTNYLKTPKGSFITFILSPNADPLLIPQPHPNFAFTMWS